MALESTNNNKILFRIDAGLRAGFGHLSRNLTLAENLKKNNFEVKFLIKTDNRDLVSEFIKKKSAVLNIKYFPSDLGQDQDLINIIQQYKKGYSFLIYDHYSHNEGYQLTLQKESIHWAQFDYKKSMRIYADILINTNITATAKDYKKLVEPNTKLCVGEEYIIISKEITKLKYKPEPQKILIAMGAGEYPPSLIKVIKELTLNTNYTFDIVSNCTSLDSLNNRKNVAIFNNPSNIGEIYSRCEVAIVAGGVTTHELAYLGVPMFVVPYTKNQVANAKSLDKKKCALFFKNLDEFYDTYNDLGLSSLIENLKRHYTNKNITIDGKGAKRIINAIKQNLLKNNILFN